MVNPTSVDNRYLTPLVSVWQATLSCHFLLLSGPSVHPVLSALSHRLFLAEVNRVNRRLEQAALIENITRWIRK